MALWLLNDPSFYSRPSRQVNQQVVDVDDILSPLLSLVRGFGGHHRPWHTQASHKDQGLAVKFGKDRFEANLDVQQFRPEEITVKVSDNMIIVEGNHEEREDEHGFVSRRFVRKYVLPEGHDIRRVESTLSSDGVLTIMAPKLQASSEEHRSIPVIQTGQPSRPAEKEEKKEE